MKLNKVILFHKRSTYQLQAIEFRDSRFIQLLNLEHQAVKRVKKAHEEHRESLEKLTNELEKRKIDFTTITRSALGHQIKDFDLLISVGGDGTFLDASHYLDSIPILGVNSALSSSFGHFCLANKDNIASILDKIQADLIKPISLMRLSVTLNGQLLPYYALNEILIAHKNPAGTSRYLISIGNIEEEQLSSGLWIGTPAGSTGSLRAAGGKVLPIDHRQFQFLVREACIRPGKSLKLAGGLLNEFEEIKIISQMRTGAIFIDGQHLEYPFLLGDELIIKPAEANLHAFVDSKVNDHFINTHAQGLTKTI